MTAAYEWLTEASLWWWPRFADHLWQTTLFALVVLVASLALRRGPARLRHNFWLLASAKFIIPAALFVFFAQQAGIDSLPFFHSAPDAEQNAQVVTNVTQPASALAFDDEVIVVATAPNDHKGVYLALTLVWFTGCATLVSVWGIRRRKFLRSLKLGSHLRTGREWEILARARETLGLKQDIGLVISPLKIEPAVWRVWRPVVVMPDSIANQLDDEELAAIMLHELVHIQRRDNLIGNLQLALCALLWFHPLVWFISRKLFDEREQACDERVMEVSGAPGAYASSILKVVRFCFGWKVAGVAGAASGSNLRRRIENIMTIGNSKRKAGAASSLLAGALVATALLVLIGAGVYSKASELNAITNAVPSESLETTTVDDAAATSNNLIASARSTLQKTKPVLPPPPPPASPLSPSTPPETSQPPQPSQPLQPAQAPQPSQVPEPAEAPEPSRAPRPSEVPRPARAPLPGHMPLPAQMPPPPQPARAGTGVGSGIGVGRGVGKGIGRGVPPPPAPVAAPASPATAPTAPPPPPPARKQPKNQRGKDKGERGNLIEAPTPVYPIEARRQRIEGTVRLKITIDEDGNVISATPQSGPEALQGASQDAGYKARFQPTTKEGKPVKVEATLAYNFVIAKH